MDIFEVTQWGRYQDKALATATPGYHTCTSLTLGTHVHERYSTHFVCVCVCPPFSGSIKRLYEHFDNGNRFFAKRKRFSTHGFL